MPVTASRAPSTCRTSLNPVEQQYLQEAVAEAAEPVRCRLNRWTIKHIERLVHEAYREGVKDRGMLVRIGQIAIDPRIWSAH